MTERLLCIDYGRKYVGLAVANMPGVTARALQTLRADKVDIISRILQIISAESVTRILLGFPFSDIEAAIHAEIRGFRDLLAQRVGEIPIDFVDESYSSSEADELMLETGLGRKKKIRTQDSEAAKIVLLRYLNAQS